MLGEKRVDNISYEQRMGLIDAVKDAEPELVL